MAVAEAARNVVCAGGRPLAVTNCLNFASPERPEIMWQFAQAVDGIAAACEALGIPVTGGNVSFYNETLGRAILPTPVIGVVGLLEDAERRTTQWFKEDGDVIVLLGDAGRAPRGQRVPPDRPRAPGRRAGRPSTSSGSARSRPRAWRRSRPASSGPLTTAPRAASPWPSRSAASPVRGPSGRRRSLPGGGRVDEALFGEAPSRIVVSVAPDDVERLTRIAGEWAVPVQVIGRVGGDRLEVRVGVAARLSLSTEALADAFGNGLSRALEQPVEALSGREAEGAA